MTNYVVEDKIILKCPLSVDIKNKIIFIINECLNKLFEVKQMPSFTTQLGVMLELTEVRDLMNDVELCDEYIFSIMNNIRNELYVGVFSDRLGLCEGMANVGIVLRYYSDKTDYYKKFLGDFDKLFVRYVKNKMQSLYSSSKDLRPLDFDVIYGMSGILQYLLEIDDGENEELIENSIKWLCNLTVPVDLGEKQQLPGWFIKSNNVVGEQEKKYFPTGQVNYGMAHGITGVLAILLKAYKRNILREDVYNAMQRIVQELEKSIKYFPDTKIGYFPEIVAPKEYIEQSFLVYKKGRMSWCYGSVTIYYILYLYYKSMNNITRCSEIVSILIEIANKGNECWKLESPIVCHGYAGTAHIFKNLYMHTHQEGFIKAYETLIEKTLESFDGSSLFGFKDIFYKEEDGKFNCMTEDKNTFLEGASGIISVLAGFLISQERVSSLLLLD